MAFTQRRSVTSFTSLKDSQPTSRSSGLSSQASLPPRDAGPRPSRQPRRLQQAARALLLASALFGGTAPLTEERSSIQEVWAAPAGFVAGSQELALSAQPFSIPLSAGGERTPDPRKPVQRAPRPTAKPTPAPSPTPPSPTPAPQQAVSSSQDLGHQMQHLPAWVQVDDTAGLYSGYDDRAIVLTRLPQDTFLRVLGARGGRLFVRFAGDADHPAGVGWVAPNAVVPSEPGDGWMTSIRATPMFSGPDPALKPFLQLDSGTLVRVLGPAQHGRTPVRLYADDFSKVMNDGWVKSDDLQTAPAPSARVREVDNHPAKPNPFKNNPGGFIEAVGRAAQESQRKTAVPAAVTVAQAILESDWGDSLLAREANNLFGIKALGGFGNDGAVWMKTTEYDDNGDAYVTVAPFRAYKSVIDAIADHDQLFRRLPRYQPAFDTSDPQEFARRIMEGGYSTDPEYADKLIALMDRYNLYRFDS